MLYMCVFLQCVIGDDDNNNSSNKLRMHLKNVHSTQNFCSHYSTNNHSQPTNCNQEVNTMRLAVKTKKKTYYGTCIFIQAVHTWANGFKLRRPHIKISLSNMDFCISGIWTFILDSDQKSEIRIQMYGFVCNCQNMYRELF